MKEVTKEQFFAHIGPMDLIYNSEGNYPFTGYWKTRNGNVIGMKVDSYPENGVYPLITRYYLNN